MQKIVENKFFALNSKQKDFILNNKFNLKDSFSYLEELKKNVPTNEEILSEIMKTTKKNNIKYKTDTLINKPLWCKFSRVLFIKIAVVIIFIVLCKHSVRRFAVGHLVVGRQQTLPVGYCYILLELLKL